MDNNEDKNRELENFDISEGKKDLELYEKSPLLAAIRRNIPEVYEELERFLKKNKGAEIKPIHKLAAVIIMIAAVALLIFLIQLIF